MAFISEEYELTEKQSQLLLSFIELAEPLILEATATIIMGAIESGKIPQSAACAAASDFLVDRAVKCMMAGAGVPQNKKTEQAANDIADIVMKLIAGEVAVVKNYLDTDKRKG